MKLLFEEIPVEINELNNIFLTERKLKLAVARLDKIHPSISGNKLFKLHYFLEEAIHSSHKTILTFGGAFSNHLAATSLACKLLGIKSIGIVRGERPSVISHTLSQCEANGMILHFITRDHYKNKDIPAFADGLHTTFGDHITIPEGGFHPVGARGASLIMDKLNSFGASHICVATGTATTLAGLLLNIHKNETLIGVPVLKNLIDIKNRISFLCGNKEIDNPVIFEEYHFGGYAKKNKLLIDFMNAFYTQYGIPTDFVYTGKMLYAVFNKIMDGFFPEGSNIICIHTGGLQGNNSLPPGTLVF